MTITHVAPKISDSCRAARRFGYLLMLALPLLTCSPPREAGPGVQTSGISIAAPTIVRIEPRDSVAIIRWQTPSDQQPAGYFIYALPTTKANSQARENAAPVNPEPFLGDTNPEDSVIEYAVGGLPNAVSLTFWVRSIDSRGRLSEPSNSAEGICLPRGEFDLQDRGAPGANGFSFVRREAVSLRDDAIDLFFVSRGGVDYLCSPTRLDGIYRENSLILLPYKGTLEQIAGKRDQFTGHVAGDRVVVQPGDWVYLLMPDKSSALVQVKSITGDESARVARCWYVYSPLSGKLPL